MAAKHLCIPASSAKVERVFSQSGLIDSPLRNRLGALMVEVLTLLKVEWDDSLYSMGHKEKVALLKDFKERAEKAGVKDPTDRHYGIPEEVQPALEEEEEDGAVDFSSIIEEEKENEIDAAKKAELDEILSVSDGEGFDLSNLDDDDEASDVELE